MMNRTKAISWLKIITMIGIYGGLLMPLIFVPKVIFPFVFSKLLYFQMLIGLTFPAYVVLAWIEPKFRPRWVPLYAVIVAYFVALGLSTIFAVDPIRAWWGNQERMNGLFTLLHFLAWLTMTSSLLTTWKQWRQILMYEIGLSVFMALVALLQKPFPKLLMFPAGPRVGGLLDNPIYMAAYQIFNLFFIALLWLKGASRSMKWWLVGFAVIDFAALLAAQSRGGLVGLAAGIVVFALTYALMTPNKKAKRTVLGLALLGFLSYGLLFAMRDTDLVRNSSLARLTDLRASTETRFIAWKIAWQGFLERPITGWGFDDFHILFNQKYNPNSLRYGYYETWFDRSHNTVMDALAMTGLLGTITFFAIFAVLFYSTYRAYRKKWIDIPIASVFFALPVAYFIQNLFVFDQPAGFAMSFFMYALIISATAAEFTGIREEVKADEHPPSHRQVPWIAFGVLQLAAVFVVWRFSVLPSQASYYTIASNNYFSANLYPESLRLARIAAEIPTPYLDEQTFLQSRNLISLVEQGSIQKVPDWRSWYDLVKKLTEQHLADHPDNTHPHFIYARLLDTFEKLVPEDAHLTVHEYEEAIRTSPKRQQLFYSFARYEIGHGNPKKGNELFQQALDFDPEVGESHWYVGLSLAYDLGRKEEGAKELIAALNTKYPYQLKEMKEAVALAGAYDVMKDKEGFREFLKTVPMLAGGSVETYLEIARAAEHLGLIEERNLILGAIMKHDPTLEKNLAPLLDGSASTIEESFKKTLLMGATSSVKITIPTSTQTTTSTAPTGPGPRR